MKTRLSIIMILALSVFSFGQDFSTDMKKVNSQLIQESNISVTLEMKMYDEYGELIREVNNPGSLKMNDGAFLYEVYGQEVYMSDTKMIQVDHQSKRVSVFKIDDKLYQEQLSKMMNQSSPTASSQFSREVVGKFVNYSNNGGQQGILKQKVILNTAPYRINKTIFEYNPVYSQGIQKVIVKYIYASNDNESAFSYYSNLDINSTQVQSGKLKGYQIAQDNSLTNNAN